MNDIRHIATSGNGKVIAVAEFERRVQIVDIDSLTVISEFDTILDFGGQRLAISEDGLICLCGSWDRYGICAYETRTGKLIWRRKDLKKVQHIQNLSAHTDQVFAQFEVGPSRSLDIYTGAEVQKLPGIEHLVNAKNLPIDVIGKRGSILVLDRLTRKTIASAPTRSFAILDIVISDDSFVVSESGGPLSCYDISTGTHKWDIPADEDGHFLRACFHLNLEEFVGVSWPFLNGGNKKLKCINKNTGEITKELVIGCPVETEFALSGQVLVTSERKVIDIQSGTFKSWL
ncbi:hypothetical protein [Dyadobacter sp. BHUBP1]|uniref:hypothetical protein n=1 Tax=Dyadobacter sp. BHUBP1 TaxID=3424178 RepID=UPI003D328B99